MADIPQTLSSWSTTAASNQPDNNDAVGPNTLADNLRVIQAVVAGVSNGTQALTTPALGTPASGTLTNATGLPVGTGISGLGTGVATALAVNVGSAGAPVVNGGALGTPSSGTLTNATGLPLSGLTGIAALSIPVANSLNTVTAVTATAGQAVRVNAGGTAWEAFTPGGVSAGSITTSGLTQNTARLLGRTTASSGAIEEISVSGGTLSGGVLTLSSGIVPLSTVSASNSATVDLETTFDSTYDAYLIVASGVTVQTDGTSIECTMKIGGSYAASGYIGHLMHPVSGAATYAGTGNVTTSIRIASVVGNAAGEGCNFTARVYVPASTSLQKMMEFSGVAITDAGTCRIGFGGGSNTGTSALTGVRFFAGTGNIVSGEFRLYGIKNS